MLEDGLLLQRIQAKILNNQSKADIGRLANENPEYLKELMIGKHLDYMKEHNLYLNGDILGIVITKVRDSGKNVIYMLMSLPFGKKDV